jgi:hypothetical protein
MNEAIWTSTVTAGLAQPSRSTSTKFGPHHTERNTGGQGRIGLLLSNLVEAQTQWLATAQNALLLSFWQTAEEVRYPDSVEVEHDIVVRMSPISSRTVRVHIHRLPPSEPNPVFE